MIKVVTIAGHSYYPGVAVTLASLVKSASHPEEIEFHILTDDLTEDDRQRLTQLGRRFGMTREVIADRPNMDEIRATCPDYKGSPLTWLTLYLPKYFPQDNWIVYCDADILWGKDVGELWAKQDESVGVFWCRDTKQTQIAQSVSQHKYNPHFNANKYCCNAVSLVNLKMLREFDFIGQAKAFIEKFGCPYYCDQDIENHLMNAHCEILDQTWNCMTPSRRAISGANIHCLGIAHQFKSGHIHGWNARNAIWFDFYNRHVAQPDQRLTPASLAKRLWFILLGLTFPLSWIYRAITLPLARRRYEQLMNFHFFAWIWLRRNTILNVR